LRAIAERALERLDRREQLRNVGRVRQPGVRLVTEDVGRIENNGAFNFGTFAEPVRAKAT
jgi:hypothetical protein